MLNIPNLSEIPDRIQSNSTTNENNRVFVHRRNSRKWKILTWAMFIIFILLITGFLYLLLNPNKTIIQQTVIHNNSFIEEVENVPELEENTTTSLPITTPSPELYQRRNHGCVLSFHYTDISGGLDCSQWGGTIDVTCGESNHSWGNVRCNQMRRTVRCQDETTMIVSWSIYESDVGVRINNCADDSPNYEINQVGSGEKYFTCPANSQPVCVGILVKPKKILILLILLTMFFI